MNDEDIRMESENEVRDGYYEGGNSMLERFGESRRSGMV